MEKVILASREFNCGSITREQFQELMAEDIEIAKQKYYDIYYNIEFESYKRSMNNAKEAFIKNAKAIAEKKWKTDKRKQQYIDEQLNVLKKHNIDHTFVFRPISFFDFKVDPSSNEIPCVCILDCININKERIGQCFDKICNNKYFRSAQGWHLVDYHGFRPQVELILSEDVHNEYIAETKKLEQEISEFYKTCSIKD